MSLENSRNPLEPDALPQADKMSIEAWEHSFEGSNSKINLPLRKIGQPPPSKDIGTILPSSSPIAETFMEARKTMGHVLVSTRTDLSTGTSYYEYNTGSGFFLNEQGDFITNVHVAGDISDNKARNITVVTADGQEHWAKIISEDPSVDLALLQVEHNAPGPVYPKDRFNAAKIARSSELLPGEQLLGCGFGADDTLHCSPNPVGYLSSTVQQKNLLLTDAPVYLNPNRILVRSLQNTSLGDSGGAQFRVSDGTVRLITDMTGDSGNTTISIPAETLIEFESGQKHGITPAPLIQTIISKIADQVIAQNKTSRISDG